MTSAGLMQSEFLKPAVALVGAGLSWTVQLVGSATVPPGAVPWIEAGGTIGLIACLVYGIVTLWKARHSERVAMTQERDALIARIDAKDSEIAALNTEFRQEWKDLVERLSLAIERYEERERGKGDE